MVTKLVKNLELMEIAADSYRQNQSETIRNKLKWRAKHVRHTLHVLPGEKLLELGAGSGIWTERLVEITKGELEITAVTFCEENRKKIEARQLANTTVLNSEDLSKLPASSFDYVVGSNILSQDRYAELLQEVERILKPSGQFLFFEDNAWNSTLRLKRLFPTLKGMVKYPACKAVIPSYQFLRNASQIGFVHIDVSPWDLLPSFLPDRMTRYFANKVYVLEHAPILKNLCGTVSMWGSKPGNEEQRRPVVNLAVHKDLHKSVSVVLPCHNESMNIGSFISRLKALYGDYLHEVIIVNDNSTDSTAEVADAMASEDSLIKVIHRRPPNGVGRALKDGYAMASGRYILSMDCDFILLLSELRDLFDAIDQGYDGAFGSRFSHNSVLLNYPFAKIVGNRLAHLIIKIFIPEVKDITNNLKLVKTEVFRSISLEEPHFAANLETGLKPILAGYQIKQVPISWVDRSISMGTSSFKPFKVGPSYFTALWKMMVTDRRKSKNSTINSVNAIQESEPVKKII